MATTLSQILSEVQEANDIIRDFLHQFSVGELLRMCRTQKNRGFSVT